MLVGIIMVKPTR